MSGAQSDVTVYTPYPFNTKIWKWWNQICSTCNSSNKRSPTCSVQTTQSSHDSSHSFSLCATFLSIVLFQLHLIFRHAIDIFGNQCYSFERTNERTKPFDMSHLMFSRLLIPFSVWNTISRKNEWKESFFIFSKKWKGLETDLLLSKSFTPLFCVSKSVRNFISLDILMGCPTQLKNSIAQPAGAQLGMILDAVVVARCRGHKVKFIMFEELTLLSLNNCFYYCAHILIAHMYRNWIHTGG